MTQIYRFSQLNVPLVKLKLNSVLELLEYAVKIGIDIDKEKHLLYIAREGLLAELPNGWKPR